jgi:hypothetical protein
MVGTSEGAVLDDSVGEVDGDVLGASVGLLSIGLSEGGVDGSNVGKEVRAGLSVGDSVGAVDGNAEGATVGSIEGASLTVG